MCRSDRLWYPCFGELPSTGPIGAVMILGSHCKEGSCVYEGMGMGLSN